MLRESGGPYARKFNRVVPRRAASYPGTSGRVDWCSKLLPTTGIAASAII